MRRAPSSSVRIGRTMLRASAERRQRRQHQAGEQQQHGAQDRRVQLARTPRPPAARRTRFQSERLDRRHRRQHRRAGEVVRHHRRLVGAAGLRPAPSRAAGRPGWSCAAPGRCRGRPPACPLRRPRRPCPCSPIRMRDTTSQMNLRFTSATVTRALVAARAHGHRHVGLGLLAEIDRAVPGLAALGVDERGLRERSLARSR